MDEKYLIGQLVGLNLSISAIKHVCRLMNVTDEERVYLNEGYTAGPRGSIFGIISQAGELGITIPESLEPKDHLSYAEALEVVRFTLAATVQNEQRILQETERNAKIFAAAFAPKLKVGRIVKLGKNFLDTCKKVNPKDIADELFSRQLKLLQ